MKHLHGYFFTKREQFFYQLKSQNRFLINHHNRFGTLTNDDNGDVRIKDFTFSVWFLQVELSQLFRTVQKRPPHNKNKNWSHAMERYNLPSAGNVEPVISDNRIRTLQNDHQLIYADTSVSLGKDVSKKAAHPTHKKPLRHLLTYASLLVATLGIMGNVPVYSRIQLPSAEDSYQPILSNINVMEEELANLEQEERQRTEQEEQSFVSNFDVVFPPEPEQPTEQKIAQADPQKDNLPLAIPTAVETYSSFAVEKPKPAEYGQWTLHTVEKTRPLKQFLTDAGFKQVADVFAKSPEIARNLKSIKANRVVLLRTKNNVLNQLIYAQDKQKAFIVTRYGNHYRGEWNTQDYTYQDTQLSFLITEAFLSSAKKSGVPTEITRKLVNVFKGDINFRRIQSGDQIGVIFQDYRYKNKSIATKALLAAEFKHNGKAYQRIRFTFNNGDTRFLRPNSDIEVKKVSFNRSPLKDGRISSGFGSRYHPVLGKQKMHKGIDIAAPKGTPIYSTGDGTIKFLGRQSGYGKVVEITHANKISTLYAHMSGFKKGLSSGDKIQRGQVIGYVGSTGRTTGNHVHYEFRVDGMYKNPITTALPSEGVYSITEKTAFQKHAASMIRKLARLRDQNSNTAKATQGKNQAVDG